MNIKILQQNICKNNKQVDEMMDALLEKEPQILLFSEFCYSKHEKNIVNRLKENNYQIIMPIKYCASCDKDKLCVCMMAIKNGITFVPNNRKEISLNLRYIEGKINFGNNKSVEILYVHAPQTWIGSKSPFSKKEVEYYQDRVEEKAEILFASYCFWNEKKDRNVFIGGDFNTEIDGGNTRGENIFKSLYYDTYDTDIHKPTWKGKCYDYALVSESIKICGCKTSRLKTTSDHIALLTEIEI